MADRVHFPAEIAAAIRCRRRGGFPHRVPHVAVEGSRLRREDRSHPRGARDDASALRRSGVDIFHVSARRFWLPEWQGSDLGIAGWVKSLTDATVIAVGSVGLDTDVMESFEGHQAKSTGSAGFSELLRRFSNHEFDMVAVGRTQIADPNFTSKLRAGRIADIVSFNKDKHLSVEHEAVVL